MWLRLCSFQDLGRPAWIAALCLCCSSCTPIKNPKEKGGDNAQVSSDVSTSQPEAGGAALSDSGSDDAGKPGSSPDSASDTPRAGNKNRGGASAETGGALPAEGTAGASAAEQTDAGARAPAESEAEPVDDEDPSYVPRTDPAGDTETVLAAEMADMDALRRLAQWNKLPVFAAGVLREQNAQDRGTGTRDEMALWPALTDGNRDLSNFICRGAQATVSVGTIAYLYDEPSCAEDYVRGVEMARFTGSGRMVRLWMTATGVTPGVEVRDEWLRIYVDDNPRPIAQLRVDQLLGGAPDEIFSTPFGSGARSSVAWHYPVVFSTKLVVALDHLGSDYFYEIDAVLDDAPQQRVAGGKRRASRDPAHARLSNPSPVPTDAVMLGQEVIALGASQQHHVELTGPATISELSLRVAQGKLAALSGVRIVAHWDDAATAAIDVPILSLFAAVAAAPNPGSLALTSRVDGNDQVFSLRLPMPFRSKAVWDLVNTGTGAAEFTLAWNGQATVPDAAFGHLGVQSHEAAIPLTGNDQAVANVSGRGRLVGVCGDLVGAPESSVLGSAQSNPMDLARGDMHITVDGELTLQSTATDHYSDNALYFADSPRSTPFAQTWNRLVDDAADQGQVSFCRWHVLGGEIDFKSSLSVTHEAAQRDTSIIKTHRTVAYFYTE
jgi:hypothetical protein